MFHKALTDYCKEVNAFSNIKKKGLFVCFTERKKSMKIETSEDDFQNISHNCLVFLFVQFYSVHEHKHSTI